MYKYYAVSYTTEESEFDILFSTIWSLTKSWIWALTSSLDHDYVELYANSSLRLRGLLMKHRDNFDFNINLAEHLSRWVSKNMQIKIT